MYVCVCGSVHVYTRVYVVCETRQNKTKDDFTYLSEKFFLFSFSFIENHFS